MSSFLRPLAYRHRWIYDTVTAVSSLSVGGVEKLRGLGLDALKSRLEPGTAVLDLCCGSGEAAAPWLAAGFEVTGLDISEHALDLAAKRHPALKRVEGLAEDPPLNDHQFSAVQLSVALHEFPRPQRAQVLRSIRRLLKPGGWLVIVTCTRRDPGFSFRSNCSVLCLKPTPPSPCFRTTWLLSCRPLDSPL